MVVSEEVIAGRGAVGCAYEEADDPCFDDGQIGGEDGKPRHREPSRGGV